MPFELFVNGLDFVWLVPFIDEEGMIIVVN